jgi:NitT/TauT family transport system permease protein
MNGDGVIRCIVVAASIIALELACRFGFISRFAVIPPTEMVVAMLEIFKSPPLLAHIATSGINIMAAVATTMVIGFFLGLVIHALPRLRRALEPVMISYYALPLFAFYPLFVVIFGVGNLSIILMGVLLGLPSMILSTLNGVDHISPVLNKVARTYHMSPMSTALRLKLPAAAPYLFTGVRLAIAYSFIGVIASEFILSGSGLGFAIGFAYNAFDTKGMYGLILLLMLFVSLLNVVLHVGDRRMEMRRRK